MSYETNTIEIKTLDSITARASNGVINAIEQASKRSGVDFSYLVQQAAAESSFNPHAKAKTSSATGLYQFIDSTWLSMVDKYGDKYGIDSNGLTNKEILEMRKDPEKASFMAAAFASENEKTLNSNWGGDTGSTELYFAHFMGASGASSFLNARDENPMQAAADLFPRAAAANRNVFYDSKDGRARSLEEVYQFFDKKFQVNGDEIDISNAPASPPTMPPPPQITENIMSYTANNRISDNVIMQKSQAMRESAEMQNNYGQIMAVNNINQSINETINETRKMPFYSLIAKPIDLMMLTQTIRDKA